MGKVVVLLLFMCVVLCGTFGRVSAHVLAGNNGVSAVMHIAPSDNPVAGQPTVLEFSFGGDSRFAIASCGCRVSVTKNGKSISVTPVKPVGTAGSTGQASVTFPDEAVYDIRLTGRSGSGASFAIPYVVRVDPEAGSPSAAGGMNVLFVGLASLVIVAMLAYYNIDAGKRYSTQADKRSIK